MSHSKERAEKICLNCQSALFGRYCHACGQENTEPKESVWGLITHFFYDITHFDGKFFSTLRYLAFKPGFLSAEYMKGRRASYLNPIRMYVFTSAFFFIVFFSIFDSSNMGIKTTSDYDFSSDSARKRKDSLGIEEAKKAALRFAGTREDSMDILAAFDRSPDSMVTAVGDTTRKGKKKKPKLFDYKTPQEYDSAQRAMPPDQRDNWLESLVLKRRLELKKRYGDNDTAMMKDWFKVFVHQFPKLLFISLPLFALILKLLYVRRKQFYYVSHGIFSIHLYIFTFIMLLISFGIGYLSEMIGWNGVLDWLQLPVWLYLMYYYYRSMRVFYGQSRRKTIVKFILLNILAFISVIILFSLFFIVAAFQL